MLSIRAPILGRVAALAAGLLCVLAPRAALAGGSPSCAPATLNTSALRDGVVTVSPLEGARDVPPGAQISFLGVPAQAIGAVSVVGSRSGAHPGRLEAYSQGNGGSFVPARPFAEGERVLVRARIQIGGRTATLEDRFDVAYEDQISSTPEAVHPGSASEEESFVSRPDLHPPTLSVTASSPAAQPGDIFVAPYSGPGQAGPEILDPSGQPLWFHPLPEHVSAANLRVQSYGGKPVLTWWQGDISEHGFGIGTDVIDDSTYTTVARISGGNGLRADLHDFQLTPAGSALITTYNVIRCGLSAQGGPSEGAVTDGTVQEIDVETGLVMFEWTSVDHVALDESYEHVRGSTLRWPFDFFHVNSISVDPDGSWLVSARNTWTVYEIEPRSGQVAWRLGGRRSSFAQAPGTRTAYQHDPRELAGGTISVFDNGASPAVRTQSRGVVLKLDTAQGTATLVRQFTHGPPLLALSQGNVQALENGDWFVGWGQEPYLTEFGPSGETLFDAHFPAHVQSYRSLRSAWTGAPAHAPTLAARPGAAGTTVLYASWNGATQIAAWRTLAGPSATGLRVVSQVPRSGFETSIPLALAQGAYVQVQALDSGGAVLGTSAPQVAGGSATGGAGT